MSRPGSTGRPSDRLNAPASSTGRPSDRLNAPASTGRPSDRLNAPTLAAFGSKGKLTPFQAAYEAGSIPCRLQHGSVRHRLSWQQPVDSYDLDPLAVYLAQGLVETTHPYSFLSQNGLQELLAGNRAASQLPGVLPRLVPHLKAALGVQIKQNPNAFDAALKCCVLISDKVGAQFNSQLASLLPSVAKLMVNGPQPVKEAVVSALQRFELNGGPEALAIIKSRIPTYTAAM